jgi:hypothetical protein
MKVTIDAKKLKVTVGAQDLSQFIYECVDEFFKTNEGFFDGLAKDKTEEDPFKTLSACYTAGTFTILRNTLRDKKKLFMKLTVDNILTNFKKGLSND